MGELEKSTLNNLINYLIKHGYPKSSFALEYSIGPFKVDLAIIEPETNVPLQIFELKSKRSKKTEEFGKLQIKRFVEQLGENIPTYLVFPKKDEPYIEVLRIDFEESEDPSLEKLDEGYINYNMQKKKVISKKINKLDKEKKKIFEDIRVVSWPLAVFLIILLFIVKIFEYNLTNQDLLLILLIIFLLIIPFAGKLKLLGFEFERLKKSK